MAWQAFLAEIIQVNTTSGFVITYTDGVQKLQRRYNGAIDDDTIKASARNEIATLEAAATRFLTLKAGDIIDTAIAVIPPPAPTPAEIARSTFLQDYSSWRQYQAAIKLGTILATDKRVTDLQSKISAEWLDAYLAFI